MIAYGNIVIEEEILGSLERRVSVIMGGASGIGASTARVFTKEGSKVVIADILDETGKELADELGAGAIYVHCMTYGSDGLGFLNHHQRIEIEDVERISEELRLWSRGRRHRCPVLP